MNTTHRLRRLVQGTAGAMLIALGLSGLAWAWQVPAEAQGSEGGRSHDAMHQMMDAMHGEGTADRMHEIDGVEEMMTQCSGMMAMMGGMDMSRMGEMMRDGGMMDGMMDDLGKSGIERDDEEQGRR